MKNITEEKEKIYELTEKLYNINPNSAGVSIRMDMLTMYFLELIENYDLMKIAKCIFNFIKDNTRKYDYPDRCTIVEGLISRCNDYFFDNNDSNDIYNRYIEFIDTYNNLDENNKKIDKPTSLEINKLEKMQKRIKQDIDNINNEYGNIKNKIEKINYDLIGTISLFIGVIFAIYGGFQLTNSVFEYIGTIEFKYLLITLSVIGFIELSIVSLLVYLVFRINDRNGKDIWKIDLTYAFLMIILIIICMVIG